MNCLLKPIYLFLFMIMFFILVPNDIYAANIPYTITTGIPARSAQVKGETFFTKDFEINYQSGRMYFSSNPDGTGDTFVDDGIEVIVETPSGNKYTFFSNYEQGCVSTQPLSPWRINSLFQPGINKVSIRLYDTCGHNIFSGPLNIVNLEAPEPTQIPTHIATLKPLEGPQPFLDLPWDYQSKGLSFNDAALSINTYFDHEYPLLSSSLGEPATKQKKLTSFRGEFDTILEYSSHDGYDYGKRAQATLNEPILASAAGFATYSNSCVACGHSIHIDHQNGYQTRYYHLQSKELITKKDPVFVNAGQKIGLLGSSGGSTGAHIHFMVVQDKNKDGDFEDNLPDGVTDPFGWQSKEIDPWEVFSFAYNGMQRTGNKSFYLWKNNLDNLDTTLTAYGGLFSLGRYSVSFPQNVTDKNLKLKIKPAPIANTENLTSIGPIINVTSEDDSGNIVNQFQEFLTFTVDFANFSLDNIKYESLSIYSSLDGLVWKKEPTIIHVTKKQATAQIDHLTFFALMAERLDAIAPTTLITLEGSRGEPGWFRSDVKLSLSPKDNEGGVGVEYTLYRINNEDWDVYSMPLTFANEGHYKVEFYSVDNDENNEEVRSVEINIDKTPPEAKIYINQEKFDLEIVGQDINQTIISKQENTETKKKDDAVYLVSDQAGNTLKLDVRDVDKNNKDMFGIFAINYDNQLFQQPTNLYKVKYKGSKEKLNIEEQNFEINGELKLSIKYDSKKNESRIISREGKDERINEIKPGLLTLQLLTNQGSLKYSY